ncbi:hypothetical protein AZF37_09095 [endosymbiont 'TC1' of Trimyema compressum]|uniref:ACP S-malonyltransferase n=1 Tax=endosymbiont 'TC1' of Trimyema compressum TaxID=243899 RepID=UPI0007F1605C|nr:ACP S-malonyltransferase [endosymbiont 'TC1' of Trimyema compressum]AMP21278.1 hypothetical protein AZF37_09095 [endosymbiont 'TC1' of Trimyema compressum]
MKVALIFPGQGVQKVGMGEEFIHQFPSAQKVFDEASTILNKDMTDLVLNGPKDVLNITSNTQPAIVTTTMAMLAVFRERFSMCHGTVGLSLGEYSSLIASGALSLEEALPLVERRGELMLNAVPEGKGGMAAVIGYNRSKLVNVCKVVRDSGSYVAPANFNSLQQIVISGEKEGVLKAGQILAEDGARVIPLNVAAPFHTPLLEKASIGLGKLLQKVDIKEPTIPLYFNAIGGRESDPESIKTLLTKQVMSPVLWVDTMEAMLKDGYDTFIEIGPGKTLAGFLKKMPYEYTVHNVNNIKTLEKTLEKIRG